MWQLTQPQLDHAVDAVGVRGGVFQCETRGQESRLKQQHTQVLDRLVVLVCVTFLLQRPDDGVFWVDLKMFLGRHVSHGAGVAQSLGLHDALHVGRPAVLRRHDAAGGGNQTVGHYHLKHTNHQVSMCSFIFPQGQD